MHPRVIYHSVFRGCPEHTAEPVSEPVNELTLGPQKRWADWEQLYAGWPPDAPLKHYWRSLALTTHP